MAVIADLYLFQSLEPRAKELKAEKLRTPKFDQKVEETEAKVKEVEQEYDRLQDEVKRLGEEAETMKPRHQEAKNAWLSKKNVLKKTQVTNFQAGVIQHTVI